jgi:hypothetical protein
MGPSSAKVRIERWVVASGVHLASLTPAEGLELILCCYREAPAGSSLWFSWGNVSVYGGEELGFQLT